MMSSYPDLRGKAAIVTGGSTGIGEAICRALAAEGVDILVIGGHNAAAAERVANDLRQLGVRAEPLIADVTEPHEVARIVATAESAFGKVDILVNNVGGYTKRGPLAEIDQDEWAYVLELNLTSTYLCTRAVLPGMQSRGWGRIVNISSISGRSTLRPTNSAYAAAKAGQLGFTRHIAREVAGQGITVNATCPSGTLTDSIGVSLTVEEQARQGANIPVGRLAVPADQAGVVVFLCSEAAAYITGVTVDVSGGRIMI